GRGRAREVRKEAGRSRPGCRAGGGRRRGPAPEIAVVCVARSSRRGCLGQVLRRCCFACLPVCVLPFVACFKLFAFLLERRQPSQQQRSKQGNNQLKRANTSKKVYKQGGKEANRQSKANPPQDEPGCRVLRPVLGTARLPRARWMVCRRPRSSRVPIMQFSACLTRKSNSAAFGEGSSRASDEHVNRYHLVVVAVACTWGGYQAVKYIHRLIQPGYSHHHAYR
ncbi:unnamed protein product, partial [Hapterophycus canaliculatus]